MQSRFHVAAILVLAGCTSQVGREGEPGITVFTAASLLPAFEAIKEEFERTHPGTRVYLNAAGSQQLARQLAAGAPGDVFASADERWMEFAQERNLVAPPSRLAGTTLVAVFAARPELADMTLLNLASPGVRLVLGGPDVPVGRYAREVLRKLGAAPGFGADFAARAEQGAIAQEDNARSLLAKVRSGEADAALVYAADLALGDSGVRRLEVPAAYNVTAEYWIAPLRAARDSTAAAEFVALALGPEGQARLARHGFLPPAQHPTFPPPESPDKP